MARNVGNYDGSCSLGQGWRFRRSVTGALVRSRLGLGNFGIRRKSESSPCCPMRQGIYIAVGKRDSGAVSHNEQLPQRAQNPHSKQLAYIDTKNVAIQRQDYETIVRQKNVSPLVLHAHLCDTGDRAGGKGRMRRFCILGAIVSSFSRRPVWSKSTETARKDAS